MNEDAISVLSAARLGLHSGNLTCEFSMLCGHLQALWELKEGRNTTFRSLSYEVKLWNLLSR